jgi:WD40 repeat protein
MFPAFSPDSKLLATCEYGNKANFVRLWDLATGKELRRLTLEQRSAYKVTFAPDGKSLAVSCGTLASNAEDWLLDSRESKTALLDLATGKELRVLAKEVFDLLAFSPDGKILAASSQGAIHLIEVITGKSLNQQTGSAGKVRALVFSPDGEKLITAADECLLRYWEPGSGKQLGILDLFEYRLHSVRFSSDGKLMLMLGEDRVPRLWDLTRRMEIRTFAKLSGFRVIIALTSDGRAFVAHEGYGDLDRAWDTSTGREINRWRAKEEAVVAVSPQRDKVCLTSSTLVESANSGSPVFDHRITMRDQATGKQQWSVTAGFDTRIYSPQFSPDGQFLAAATGAIHLWKVATGECLAPVLGGSGPVAFSPDFTLLVSVAEDNTVHVWDFATLKELRCFRGHLGGINAVAFAPDSKTLASASDDTTVIIWDLADLRH